jgi:F-type H+-transporting ATPase subunit gamma
MKAISIKRRINSVKKVSEITFAMEAVSAIKMKKFQEYYKNAKPFVKESMKILDVLLKQNSFSQFPQRKSKKILMVVVASDRGLCGSFNTSVLKYAYNEIQKLQKRYQIDLMVIGKKGVEYFKYRKIEVKSFFFGIGDYATLKETDEIAKFIYQKFYQGDYQRVFIVYNAFISSFVQKPTMIQFLPPQKETIEVILREKIKSISEKRRTSHSFEPKARTIFRVFIPFLLSTQIYHIILESNAAEHSARMIAMHNASENAERLEEELTLQYNKMRQAQITTELMEITTAKEAM